MKYIDLEVKTATIFHCYDSANQPVEETVNEDSFMRKLVAVDRIRSVSEQFILVTGADNREMYWEYKGTLEDIKHKLQSLDVAIA